MSTFPTSQYPDTASLHAHTSTRNEITPVSTATNIYNLSRVISGFTLYIPAIGLFTLDETIKLCTGTSFPLIRYAGNALNDYAAHLIGYNFDNLTIDRF
jgi:hypothetical protein